MLLLLLLFLLLFLWFAYENLPTYLGKRPPGPIRFPLIGNLPQLVKWAKKEPCTHIMLGDLTRKYGPIYSIKFGSLEQLIIDDTELIRDILTAEEWGIRPINKYVMERSYGFPHGILWGRGESYKEMRRFSLRTLRDFGFGKQKSQDAVMEEELTELMSRLDQRLLEEGGVICMQQFFNVSVLNIIWGMTSGQRYSHDDKEFKILAKKINDNMRLLSATGNILLAFPFLNKIVPALTGYGAVRKKVIGELQDMFSAILKERKASSSSGEVNDYIDVFVQQMNKFENTGNALEDIYSEKNFVTTVLDLFVAGSETTANSLEYSILYMILKPEVQKKAQEEIDSVMSKGEFPTFEHKQKMPYTEATVLEVLRLSSIVSLIVRANSVDCKIRNYTIPKETWTILNTYRLHRDETIWKNPEEFDPQRFLDPSGRVINGEKLVPFGLGKRYCLGEILARATLFVYFTSMLQNYTFSLPDGMPVPSTKGLPGITLSPQKFFARIEKRKKL